MPTLSKMAFLSKLGNLANFVKGGCETFLDTPLVCLFCLSQTFMSQMGIYQRLICKMLVMVWGIWNIILICKFFPSQ